MKSVSFIAVALAVACMVQVSSAESIMQQAEPGTSAESIGENRYESKFSLLDPNRFSMSHSYSLSYFSGGGDGQMIGLYINSMKYQLSNSIDVSVKLGWLHQPSNMFSQNRGVTDYGTVLPNFQLQYHPSEKFKFMISFESIPGVYSDTRRDMIWPYMY